MSTYVYSEERIKELVAQSRRAQGLVFIVTGVIVIAAAILFFYGPKLPIFHSHIWDVVSGVLIAVCVHPFMHYLRYRKRGAEVLRDSLRASRVEIASGNVSVTYFNRPKREIRVREISRAEEPARGSGLYLRSSNRYRWILIPRKLDGYEDIKREINLAGVPIVQTSVPPNIEEFVFILVFVATMTCVLAVHDVRVLEVNLIIAVLLGLAGLYIINSNPDNPADPRLRKIGFGAFIPAVVAAAGLWIALRGGW